MAAFEILVVSLDEHSVASAALCDGASPFVDTAIERLPIEDSSDLAAITGERCSGDVETPRWIGEADRPDRCGLFIGEYRPSFMSGVSESVASSALLSGIDSFARLERRGILARTSRSLLTQLTVCRAETCQGLRLYPHLRSPAAVS